VVIIGILRKWNLNSILQTNFSRISLRKVKKMCISISNELFFINNTCFSLHTGKAVTLTTQKDKKKMMFPTPMGKSYACDEETTVELKGSPDIEASVLLRNFKVQPFIWKSDNFGPGKFIIYQNI
jgi:hypothetical protein